MTTAYIAGERSRAARWKRTTPDLPDEARADAPFVTGTGQLINGSFPWCLPPALAAYNLLPDARATGLEAFSRLGIPWNAGIGAGPSNNLLGSQVQCANALAPLLGDPKGVRSLFSPMLPVAEVLPIENGWYLTFEWIGLVDHLGEDYAGRRTRGAFTTSADAAIRYRALDGSLEVALIEWKYTEDYTGWHDDDLARLEQRMATRRWIWDGEACPIRRDQIRYGDLFVEPRYQLFRLTMLAWHMEQAAELGAERVRFLVAAPFANLALRDDLRRWRRLLVTPDRFCVLDTARLLDFGAPTSTGYKRRYE